MIPVYKPYIAPNTKKYLEKVVEENWFSTGGYFYEAVQERLKTLLKAKYVLPVNNGTSATYLLSKILLNKKNTIKKLICQNSVYVAAWNSFLFDKNLELEILDIDLETWNYNKQTLEKQLEIENPNETALLVVHNIGNPFSHNEKNFLVVEDNCEGFLGKYHNQKNTGTECLASSISFFANKNITCGEGGAVVTNDEESYEVAKIFHGQGQSKIRFIHSEMGNNFRMTNLAAAVLLSQIECLDQILEEKERVFSFYKDAFSGLEKIEIQKTDSDSKHSGWMFGIRIKNGNYSEMRDYFEENGIETRPAFYSASDQPYLKNSDLSKFVKIHDDKNTKILNKEGLILPSYPSLTDDELKKIATAVTNYVEMKF